MRGVVVAEIKQSVGVTISTKEVYETLLEVKDEVTKMNEKVSDLQRNHSEQQKEERSQTTKIHVLEVGMERLNSRMAIIWFVISTLILYALAATFKVWEGSL